MKPSQVSDNDMARRISIEYTTAAAWLFNDICQKPFRFVYCSGYLAERDQTKQLWYLQDYRRIRVNCRVPWLTNRSY